MVGTCQSPAVGRIWASERKRKRISVAGRQDEAGELSSHQILKEISVLAVLGFLIPPQMIFSNSLQPTWNKRFPETQGWKRPWTPWNPNLRMKTQAPRWAAMPRSRLSPGQREPAASPPPFPSPPLPPVAPLGPRGSRFLDSISHCG